MSAGKRTPLAELEADLSDADARIARVQAELDSLQESRERIWHELVACKFGVRLGDRVLIAKSTPKRPESREVEYQVCGISSWRGSSDAPWITGLLVRSDGTVSKVQHPLYDRWRPKDPRTARAARRRRRHAKKRG